MNLDLLRVRAPKQAIATLAYEARRPRGVTLVVGHGYSSSKQNLDLLCAFLASHGFAVYSLDFPGHKLGASGGRLEAAEDLIDAMAAVIAEARARGATTLYALGHSMGATTALCAAGRDPTIDGTISIATGYGRPQALAALARGGVVDLRSSYVEGLALPELAQAWQPLLDTALAPAGRSSHAIHRGRARRNGQSCQRRGVVWALPRAEVAGERGERSYLRRRQLAGGRAGWLNERHPRETPAAEPVPVGVDAPL